MNRIFRSALTVAVLACVAGAALAETRTTGLYAGVGTMSGHTTYQIGGHIVTPTETFDVYFPISELEFPMNVLVATVGGNIRLASRLTLGVSGSAGITKNAGTMKDSDWTTPSRPNQLDVYSESDATLDDLEGDVDIRYTVMQRPNWSLDLGVGFLYQDQSYECKLIRQWSPSGAVSADVVGDGRVGLTYDTAYTIPYVEIALGVRFDARASAEFRADVSPFVKAWDKDVHLLRDPPITAEGDYDGQAARLSARGEYLITDHWFVLLDFRFMSITTSGTQKNYIRGEWSHTTDAETSSEQAVATLSTGVGF